MYLVWTFRPNEGQKTLDLWSFRMEHGIQWKYMAHWAVTSALCCRSRTVLVHVKSWSSSSSLLGLSEGLMSSLFWSGDYGFWAKVRDSSALHKVTSNMLSNEPQTFCPVQGSLCQAEMDRNLPLSVLSTADQSFLYSSSSDAFDFQFGAVVLRLKEGLDVSHIQGQGITYINTHTTVEVRISATLTTEVWFSSLWLDAITWCISVIHILTILSHMAFSSFNTV